MSTEQTYTLEQIEAHLKSANIEQYDKPGASAADAQQDLAGTMRRICSVYRGIKPVLSVIANFPLLPGSIKSAIRAFMNVMNTLCP